MQIVVIRLALCTGGAVLKSAVPIVAERGIVLKEDRRLPIFLRGNYGRATFAASGDVVVAGFPATAVVAGEALVMATVILMPCLFRADFLPDFVLAVAERCTCSRRALYSLKGKGKVRTHSNALWKPPCSTLQRLLFL